MFLRWHLSDGLTIVFCLPLSSDRPITFLTGREQKRTTHLSQSELEERAKKDVLRAKARREETAERQRQLKEADHRKKTVAKGRWAGVEADPSRLLRGTKVRVVCVRRRVGMRYCGEYCFLRGAKVGVVCVWASGYTLW